MAEKLLRNYCPSKLLAFMFRHGRASAACQLIFPPGEDVVELSNEGQDDLAKSR